MVPSSNLTLTAHGWIKIYAAVKDVLKLPCGLRFSDQSPIGMHTFMFEQRTGQLDRCEIVINPKIALFLVPEHLVLHEAAHHFNCELSAPLGLVSADCGCFNSHCHHWAAILYGLYRKTGMPLPKTSGYPEFARAANIGFTENLWNAEMSS